MKYLSLIFMLCLNNLCFADTLSGSGVGTLAAGSTGPESINSSAHIQNTGGVVQGTLIFDLSAIENYNAFAETLSVCVNSKGMVIATGTMEGYHTIGTNKTPVTGTYSVVIAPGSKGSVTISFNNFTTNQPVFPKATYNLVSGGYATIAGSSCN